MLKHLISKVIASLRISLDYTTPKWVIKQLKE
jgi:hypothetical protein